MLSGALTVPESFTSALEGTVNTFTSSLGNYAPVIIGFAIAVVALLGFWALIKRWGKGIFRGR